MSAPDPSTALKQQQMLKNIFSAARGVAPLNLTGDAPVTTQHLKQATTAQQGLRAILAQSASMETSKNTAPRPQAHEGLKGAGRVGLGLATDIGTHIAATALLGPIGGILSTAYSAGRIMSATARSAATSARPAPMAHQKSPHFNPSEGYFGTAKGGFSVGRNGVHRKGAQNEYQSFAAQSDQRRAGTPIPSARPGYAARQAEKFGKPPITLAPQQRKTAQALLHTVEKKAAGIDELIATPKMNATHAGIVTNQRLDQMSFADYADMVKNGGRVSLAQTGTVATEAIKKFSTRNLAPTRAQQMALAPGFA